MEIFRNNKWDIVTFTNGLTELLLQGHKIFKEYYKKDKDRILEEDMNEAEIKDILYQLDEIEKLSKDELKPLLIDLQMMLEEYRENGSAIILK
jgi:tRNA G18 (ribose-2'-O)-methylase SpoU